MAIDEAVCARGIVAERVEFPSQAAGKRRTDPPAVCVATVRGAAEALAARLSVSVGRIAVGGRSFGGACAPWPWPRACPRLPWCW